MKKLLLLLLCISQQSMANNNAPSGRDIDYQKLYPMLNLAKGMQSPYAKISSLISVKKQGLTLQDVKLTLRVAEQPEQDINIDEHGILTLPLLPKELAKNAKLHINQDKDDVSLSMSTEILPPAQKQVPYHDLFILLDDSNKFMKEMAGMASWFVPSMDSLKFTFEHPATIEIASAKQTYRFNTDKDNSIEIKIKKKLMAENPMVVFSELPKDMSPED